MTSQDAETIVAIAALAALSDGNQTDAERINIAGAAARLGVSADSDFIKRTVDGQVDVETLAARLSSDEARLAAYDAAAAVCHADGAVNQKESAFLAGLSRALGAVATTSQSGPTLGAASAAMSSTPSPATGDLDTFILDQAMLTAACELLPQRLSGMAILPLQLHMAYTIGQRHGQQFGLDQAKDLLAVFGLGAAGHVMEGVVRGILGGVGRGLFGGLIGGAAGLAAGTAVTFATTYALGHASQQYYAQGRQLSAEDLKTLFARFQEDAKNIFPKVEDRIRDLASSTNLNSVLANLRA